MDQVRDLLEDGLRQARAQGATYAEIRVVERQEEDIQLKNGHVDTIASDEHAGFGVRVLASGAWGFASAPTVSAAAIAATTAAALEIAQAAAAIGDVTPVHLPALPPVVATVPAPYTIDPFLVPLGDKLDLLLRADAGMAATPGVSIRQAFLNFRRERKILATTEGTYIDQARIDSGGGIQALAVGDGDLQRRSYPNNHGSGDIAMAGYEFILEQDLVGNAARVGREAVELLAAPACPTGEYDLIIDSAQLALQIHESCGHPVELDRVLGTEAAFAGTSFLTPDKLGHFRYGSPIVNLYGSGVEPRGLGSFAYDDEGRPTNRGEIVREGLFVGYLTSRETAAALGIAEVPAMRADGWNRLPLIRMTNVCLEPGDAKLEDIIADTRRGLFVSILKSGSIDDRRLNFQFGSEIGWLIEDGRLTRMVKNPSYTGITPTFWNACDAIADRASWRLWGLNNCGKGEPLQIARVGHGCAPARFHNIHVGVVK